MENKITINEKFLTEVQNRLEGPGKEMAELKHKAEVNRMEVDLIISMLEYIKE